MCLFFVLLYTSSDHEIYSDPSSALQIFVKLLKCLENYKNKHLKKYSNGTTKVAKHFHFQQYSNHIYASLVFPIRQDKLAVHKHNFEDNVYLAVKDGDLGCRDETKEHLKENREFSSKHTHACFVPRAYSCHCSSRP